MTTNNQAPNESAARMSIFRNALVAIPVGIILSYCVGGKTLALITAVSLLIAIFIMRLALRPANWGQTHLRVISIGLIALTLSTIGFPDIWFIPVINSILTRCNIDPVTPPPFWQGFSILLLVGAITTILHFLWKPQQALAPAVQPATYDPPTPIPASEPVASPHESVHPDAGAVQCNTSNLPVTVSELFGRDGELALLDEAWVDEKFKVFVFVAWGGVGKSALVNEWLERMADDQWRGARRVYGWSFYSQGAKEQGGATSDGFFLDALKWFGDEAMALSKKTGREKAMRLVELIRQERTLLILDGLEPLQYPPGAMGGRLKDDAVAVLLRNLAKSNSGLCVVTTREEVKDVEGSVGHGVKRVDLESLSKEAGAGVLRDKGVVGTDKELENTSEEFGGHALALNLLGKYLAVVHGGEVRKKDLVPKLTDEKEKGGHAKRVMESYEVWLRGSDEPALDVLYLMGLFDRPAKMGAVDVLRGGEVIEGLNDKLTGLDEVEWEYTLKHR